ncbi:hypothetical protein LC593_00270 [Nostoc sp. CHAB 5844]|nr:hypothetical protein [Nostoc sp. CHAB 5844]
MIFLVDHNLEGHALLLLGNIASLGWLDDRFLKVRSPLLSHLTCDRQTNICYYQGSKLEGAYDTNNCG